MDDVKPWWRSKTIWLALLGLVLSALGVDVEDPEIASVVDRLAMALISLGVIVTRAVATRRVTWW